MKRLAVCLIAVWLIAVPACKKKGPIAPASAETPTVAPSPAPAEVSKPEIQFSVNPGSISKGESATLQWQSRNASSVVIDSGVGNVSQSGSVVVSPGSSTTFTAVASNSSGEAQASVRVTVVDRPVAIQSSDIGELEKAIADGRVKPVFFAYDRFELSEESKAVLDENARWFRQWPKAPVMVGGHCDERGTEEYNLALGDRRAQVAFQYLIDRGVNPEQMESVSFGEERPFAQGQSESDFSQNRRAHFSVKAQ
jgi:peptidoglycan-associated lipoprotein